MITSTKAQLVRPFESYAQFSFPVFVGVTVGDAIEHGSEA